jgi:predicted short-subunit dehydrogenase-like oxidoreductase (DUF2520 family)
VARRPTVAIVGCGRTGGSIGFALASNGYDITATWSHSRAGRQRAQRLLNAPVLAEPGDVAAAAEIVFLTVPDDAIATVAKQVAPAVRSKAIVVHTSGGLSVDVLAPVREAGARVGCLHPLQTLPDPVLGAEALKGAAVAVTASPQDRLALQRLARAWGGRPFPLDDDKKAIYHAAAVFASNYVVTSIWAATQLLESVGVHNPRGVLAPLIQTTIDNVLANGPRKAITGPVVRGDTSTVRRHIRALEQGPAREAYRALARLTATLAGTEFAEKEPA